MAVSSSAAESSQAFRCRLALAEGFGQLPEELRNCLWELCSEWWTAQCLSLEVCPLCGDPACAMHVDGSSTPAPTYHRRSATTSIPSTMLAIHRPSRLGGFRIEAAPQSPAANAAHPALCALLACACRRCGAWLRLPSVAHTRPSHDSQKRFLLGPRTSVHGAGHPRTPECRGIRRCPLPSHPFFARVVRRTEKPWEDHAKSFIRA